MPAPESAPPSRGAVAAADHDLSDAEFAELDELLSAVPEPLEPLDAVMLDGFLCGVVVQPALFDADAWLPFVFDAGGHRWGEAEPGPEQRRARVLILRRLAALNRSIAEHGSFDPFMLEPGSDESEAEGEGDDGARAAHPLSVALAPWLAGFEQALQVLPALVDLDDAEVRATLARLLSLLPDESPSSSGTVERAPAPASLDVAIGELVACVVDLYDLTMPLRYKVEPVRHAAPKVGRNDPCPCGSGRKFKQCHGAAS